MSKIKNSLIFTLKYILVFLIISMIIFAVVRLLPTPPTDQWLSAYNLPRTDENIKWVTEKMGLNKPIAEQYINWIRNFFVGDWGKSLISNAEIFPIFLSKMPISLSIGFIGTLLAGILGFLLGYGSAYSKYSWCDKLSSALVVLTQSLPSFIVAIIIIHFLSIKLKLFYFFSGSIIAPLIISILLTCLYTAGGLARIVKLAYQEEMKKSYVRMLVTLGFSRSEIMRRHILRPILIKLLAAILSRFAWVFGGSTVLEFAFAMPGISYFLVDSMQKSDYNVLQTYVLVVILWMFFIHILLSILIKSLDIRRLSNEQS